MDFRVSSEHGVHFAPQLFGPNDSGVENDRNYPGRPHDLQSGPPEFASIRGGTSAMHGVGRGDGGERSDAGMLQLTTPSASPSSTARPSRPC